MTTGLRELGTFLWSREWKNLLRRRRSRPSSKSRKHYHLVPVCLSILRRFCTSQDLIISVGGKKTNVNVISFTYAKTTPKINVSSCPNQLYFILFWTVCKCGVGYVHVSTVPKEARGIRSPMSRAGISDSCKSPDMSDGNWFTLLPEEP